MKLLNALELLQKAMRLHGNKDVEVAGGHLEVACTAKSLASVFPLI